MGMPLINFSVTICATAGGEAMLPLITGSGREALVIVTSSAVFSQLRQL